MNGPFRIANWGAKVLDADDVAVAEGEGNTEEKERANAEMVCNALNATYYAAQAANGPSHG